MNIDSSTNILLKYFPKRLEQEDLFKHLAINESLSYAKTLPNSERKDVLAVLESKWFFVNSHSQTIYDSIYDCFLKTFSYRHQNNYIQILNATKEWHKFAEKKGYKPPILNNFNVYGFSIIGISGVGKTHCTRHILSRCFNQIIKLPNGDMQITYLFTNCKSIGSLKELLVSFLNEVDRLIGTNYYEDYIVTKNSTEKLEAVVANICVRHYIGIWFIDEVHHLKNVPFRSKEQTINFLKNISAVIGMPIVYIGTPEAKSILAGNFQIARRAEGNGSIFWERYLYTENEFGNNESETEWEILISSLWKRQILNNPGKLTPDIYRAYYECSQGIMARLIAIHIRVQNLALNEGEERITPELIYRTKPYFQFSEKMINALASGKEELISEFEDLSMRAYNVIENVSRGNLSHKEIVEVVTNSNFSQEETTLILKAIMNMQKDEMNHKELNASDNKKTNIIKKKKEKAKGIFLDDLKKSATPDDIYNMLNVKGITNAKKIIGQKR